MSQHDNILDDVSEQPNLTINPFDPPEESYLVRDIRIGAFAFSTLIVMGLLIIEEIGIYYIFLSGVVIGSIAAGTYYVINSLFYAIGKFIIEPSRNISWIKFYQKVYLNIFTIITIINLVLIGFLWLVTNMSI